MSTFGHTILFCSIAHSNKSVIFFGLRVSFVTYDIEVLISHATVKGGFKTLFVVLCRSGTTCNTYIYPPPDRKSSILDLNFGLHNWTPVYGAARRYYN
jgi:hypothetical protein